MGLFDGKSDDEVQAAAKKAIDEGDADAVSEAADELERRGTGTPDADTRAWLRNRSR